MVKIKLFLSWFIHKREQLRDHEERVQNLEAELEDHRRHPPERSAKSLNIQNYKEKDVCLHYEVRMFTFYQLSAVYQMWITMLVFKKAILKTWHL